MQTEKTLPELTMDLAGQVGDLLRNEVRLARAEALEGVKQMGGGIVRAALGVALAGSALTLALFAAAYALGQAIPMWAGALIASVIGGVIAYVLVKSGLKAASVDHLSMDRTAAQVTRDLRTLSRKVD
ncbi:MAG: phage holin family protein [Vitreimonas sp.]